MDRRKTVEAFRERLGEVIERSGLSRMAFAARVGLDRSTLSQLLSSGNERLPRAETIAAIAAREQVSVDWLLGLSQEGQLGADIVAPALEIESGAASPADERLARWHAEAAGYKIRYVPTILPDLLKTEEVIRYEYQDYGAKVPKARIEQAEERLAYSRLPETDMEVCSSLQSVEGFARGQGVWKSLPVDSRIAQLNAMIVLLDELYPTFRWFLFDGLQRYSVPLTIFGPKRAAVYVGNMYFVLNSTEHIQVLTRHFDDLIRAAVIQPPDVIRFLEGLLRELEPGLGEAVAERKG
jgi:transcriptional regulator with XRE-family HTH domain